ncbi:hypothetical protein K08M3_50190 [Vibrio alginolyticus]|jgi:hypothetical protein|uniref:Uncharacterized protein n=1 Tax=Vibrio alginolyticus TaxID=663 RepID=A0A1W6UFD3_VIBAL|nr:MULTISPECIES: hypothetical protein [Vibrio harveyi group]ARP06529.1 hypothetical protein K04M1_50060 [Vibrio alginolyticus]ARP11662.1 hypothetical protein K04M3_50930 [Vibrio alginolyticus]ARP16715.1 hypothetical protein K04M5_50630 [Vibrio alginolyticus]ARP21734.1 hypothetical protein K05K4_50250 [Vibrio alginolyticus]ARP21752.1 hypothetical protein K05K4_50500 [Vibrio alginolyticus]
MSNEQDPNLEKLHKLDPVKRRKFLAVMLGGSVGTIATLVSPNANAFLGLSPTELLEKFLDKAGQILMMFIANRYYKNFIEAWNEYTDVTKESRAKENGLLSGTFQNSVDFEMNFDKTIQDNVMMRRTETSPRVCQDTQQSGLVVQSIKASTANMDNIATGQSKIFYSTDFPNISDYRASYIDLVETTTEGQGVISLKNLSMIFGTGAFPSVSGAQSEFSLLLADIVRSPDHDAFKWKEGVNPEVDEDLAKGSLAIEKRNFRDVSKAVQANIIIEGLSYAMARRVGSKSLTEAMRTTLLGAGANKAQKAISDGGPYFSGAEALLLEVESKALEPGYLKELNSYSDPTPVLYYVNSQQALLNRIKHERMKIAKLRNSISAINSALEIERREA